MMSSLPANFHVNTLRAAAALSGFNLLLVTHSPSIGVPSDILGGSLLSILGSVSNEYFSQSDGLMSRMGDTTVMLIWIVASPLICSLGTALMNCAVSSLIGCSITWNLALQLAVIDFALVCTWLINPDWRPAFLAPRAQE